MLDRSVHSCTLWLSERFVKLRSRGGAAGAYVHVSLVAYLSLSTVPTLRPHCYGFVGVTPEFLLPRTRLCACPDPFPPDQTETNNKSDPLPFDGVCRMPLGALGRCSGTGCSAWRSARLSSSGREMSWRPQCRRTTATSCGRPGPRRSSSCAGGERRQVPGGRSAG